MNLFQLIHTIKNTAGKANLVSSVKDGDVYENLNSGTQTYPVVNVTIDNITKEETGTSNVTMNIFYIDRLEDNCRNKTQVQSSAVTVLEQIMNRLEDEQAFDFTSKTFYPFTEKFADLCAGSYVTCTLDLQLDTLCDDDSFEPKTLNIQSNGLYDVAGYDEANVNVSAAGAIDYYWIMPHNYGVPQINYSDLTTTLEIKFRLKSTTNQSIYDDGYTSLIYEDNQYKARLNGGEWKETIIRETDAPETRVVNLTGTKLQIGYYLFDLEDGGHQWTYGQQMYIGKGENVGDIDIYYCKLYWDKGDFVDYEPFIENGETVLKDAVSGKVLSIDAPDVLTLQDDLDGWWNNKTYDISLLEVTDLNYKVEIDFIPLTAPASGKNIQYISNSVNVDDNHNLYCIRQWQNLRAIFAYKETPSKCVYDSSGNCVNFEYGERYKVSMDSQYGEINGVKTEQLVQGDAPTGTVKLFRQIDNTSAEGIVFSLTYYHNDEKIMELVPKKITGTNTHILFDTISKKIYAASVYDSVNGIMTLEADEPSDFQTLTVSNEEYEAVKPVLAKIRGEEIVDDEPRAVVE